MIVPSCLPWLASCPPAAQAGSYSSVAEAKPVSCERGSTSARVKGQACRISPSVARLWRSSVCIWLENVSSSCWQSLACTFQSQGTGAGCLLG